MNTNLLCPLLLNMNEVANAIGIIQRARVNLIVVATFKSFFTVCCTGPTTELVS